VSGRGGGDCRRSTRQQRLRGRWDQPRDEAQVQQPVLDRDRRRKPQAGQRWGVPPRPPGRRRQHQGSTAQATRRCRRLRRAVVASPHRQCHDERDDAERRDGERKPDERRPAERRTPRAVSRRMSRRRVARQRRRRLGHPSDVDRARRRIAGQPGQPRPPAQRPSKPQLGSVRAALPAGARTLPAHLTAPERTTPRSASAMAGPTTSRR
jgi:hypothetical protein